MKQLSIFPEIEQEEQNNETKLLAAILAEVIYVQINGQVPTWSGEYKKYINQNKNKKNESRNN